MHIASPFPATILRAPSDSATCTCEHWAYCDHACHHRTCDPTENACDIGFLPDEGGLTAWGCAACTPGEGAAHVLGCELIGWNVAAGSGQGAGLDSFDLTRADGTGESLLVD